VDIIWFDSIADKLDRWPCADLFRKIRCWQPEIIMNNRGAAVLAGYNQEPEELSGATMTHPNSASASTRPIGPGNRASPWSGINGRIGRAAR